MHVLHNQIFGLCEVKKNWSWKTPQKELQKIRQESVVVVLVSEHLVVVVVVVVDCWVVWRFVSFHSVQQYRALERER
jgi:flagellar biogenesis protein FliO